jgi:Carboxypeptidase regulatory-like domain
MTNLQRNRSLRRSFLSVLWLCSLPALAQCSSNIRGVVSDPAGGGINGALVRLRNINTGVTAVITTVESGNYRFNDLPAGNYAVTAEATGFRKVESSFMLSTSRKPRSGGCQHSGWDFRQVHNRTSREKLAVGSPGLLLAVFEGLRGESESTSAR